MWVEGDEEPKGGNLSQCWKSGTEKARFEMGHRKNV
jgi:hypothetical protein